MFTGIVDHCGTITSTEAKVLKIACQFEDLQLGESIAIDGICLTVTKYGPGYFECEISPETCQVTTASQFKTGKRVNLERALRLSDRLGGHIVQGHVDHVAQVCERSADGEYIKLGFTGIAETGAINCARTGLIIKKGSIAINGVSLTINNITPQGFDVMLIPHTLGRTNLNELKMGEQVNIEYDWLAKIISQQLQQYIPT